MGKRGKEQQVRMGVAALIVIFLIYLTGSALWAYLNAFFVALFSYVLLKPLYSSLRKHGLGKTTSAASTMIYGIIIAGIPIAIFFLLLVSETVTIVNQMIETDPATYSSLFASEIAVLEGLFPGFDVKGAVNDQIIGAVYMIVDYFKEVVIKSVQDAGGILLQALVAMFMLYYMLVSENSLSRLGNEVVPFNRKNREKLIAKFNEVTYSVLICIGLVGVIQAVPLMLMFIYYQVPAAVFLGFMALILSCIPFVGVHLVWIPIAVIEALQGRYEPAIAITAVGLVMFGIDNLRPFLQSKVGSIHPLIVLLGIIMGLTYFGVLGVLIGPLLLSYSIITIRMFKEEYLS